MTRYAVDADVALTLAFDERSIDPAHTLVAAASVRSLMMTQLYRRMRSGGLEPRNARALLERVAELKMRVLGDRGSRAMAWRLAIDLDRDDIGPLETLAVAVLQADALVTVDPVLVAAADGRVPVAAYEDLFLAHRRAEGGGDTLDS